MLQAPEVQAALLDDCGVVSAFHIYEQSAGVEFFRKRSGAHVGVLPVTHCGDQSARLRQVIPRGQMDAVFVPGLGVIGKRIVNMNLAAMALQFTNHINHFAVAQVGAVLLEGEAEHDLAHGFIHSSAEKRLATPNVRQLV